MKAPILIVGASRGIGHALAEKLLNDGMDVIGVSRSGQGPSGAQLHACDVVEDGLDSGIVPDTLSGLVYCPGSIDLKPARGIKPDDMLSSFNLNVVSGFKCVQSCLPALKKASGSSILFFSTVAVQRGMAFHSSVAASKGAVEGMSRALAAELAPTVRVNCIAPSLTRTDLAEPLINSDSKLENAAQRHPLKRIGEPIDIAAMGAFLLSDEASWITGQIIGVDGGLGAI